MAKNIRKNPDAYFTRRNHQMVRRLIKRSKTKMTIAKKNTPKNHIIHSHRNIYTETQYSFIARARAQNTKETKRKKRIKSHKHTENSQSDWLRRNDIS